LQEFVAGDEVTIRCNTELHVLVALVSKLLIIILQYFAGLLLSVEEVLHVGLRSLQLIDAGLKLCS
jgi:hypothetical protein